MNQPFDNFQGCFHEHLNILLPVEANSTLALHAPDPIPQLAEKGKISKLSQIGNISNIRNAVKQYLTKHILAEFSQETKIVINTFGIHTKW